MLLAQHYSWADGRGPFTDGVEIYIDYDGKLIFKRLSLYKYTLTGPVVPADRWTHIAASYDGSKMRLYINGQEQASLDNVQYVGGSNLVVDPMTIGSGKQFIDNRIGFYDHPSFVGLMDEVTLAPRALSAAEIRENYRYQAAWVEEEQEFPLTIDAEAPASRVVLAGTGNIYVPNSFRRELITSSDVTSRVALAELGAKRDDQASISWSVADPCQDAAGGMAWCPGFDPSAFGGEGRYTLQSRATDIAGNRETPQAAATLYVDATPPQATLVAAAAF